MLMVNDSQPPGFDVSSYTIEEINSITSEYTLKNTVSTSDRHLAMTNEHPESLRPYTHIHDNIYLFLDRIWEWWELSEIK